MSNYLLSWKKTRAKSGRSGTMFFKARSQFFFGISKKKLFTIIVTFKMTIEKYLKKKKNLSKKFANKIGKKNLWKKNWKSTFFFYQKYFLMVILKVTIMVNKFFFRNSKKNLRMGLKKHSSGLFLT